VKYDFETGDGTTDDSAILFVTLPRLDWFKQNLVKALQEMGNPLSWVKYGTVEPDWAQNEANKMLGSIQFMNGNPFPIGKIDIMATEEIPEGWLLCDGTTYARVDYPELYEAIAGSCHVDADNFFVPDLRLPRLPGYTDVSSVGQQNSDDWSVFIFENNMPTHSHEITIIDPSHTHADFGDVITTVGLIGEIPAPVTVQTPSEIVPAVTGITAVAGNTGGSEALELPDIPITGVRYMIWAGR
jgi:microcystin-dependent protein